MNQGFERVFSVILPPTAHIAADTVVDALDEDSLQRWHVVHATTSYR